MCRFMPLQSQHMTLDQEVGALTGHNYQPQAVLGLRVSSLNPRKESTTGCWRPEIAQAFYFQLCQETHDDVGLGSFV